MYPILFHLGPLTIYTVSIFHGLGCAAGVWLLFRRIEKTGWDKELVSGLVSVVIVWSVIGARLFSILFDGYLEWYLQNPEHIFMVWEGGFTFYGGFLFALAAGLWYARRKRMPIWRLSDMAAPALALGSAVGRLGCFASGDSFGKPTDLPWGVVYRDPHSLAPTGIALHPTQLYSVLTNLLLLGGGALVAETAEICG